MSITTTPFPGLPPDIAQMIASAMFCEFGTISAQGVPIDTPLFCFADPSSRTIDVGTGLAYPAKAERARRNSKVGLLLEGGPSLPVISIGALATVKDADIQANAERYIAEVIAYFEAFSAGNPWSVAREAVWYWARILMLATPKKILWWRSPAHMDVPPERWDAPADFAYPPSDPAPKAAPSAAAQWPKREWRERAQELLAQNMTGHLTLIDDEGYPLPLRTRICGVDRRWAATGSAERRAMAHSGQGVAVLPGSGNVHWRREVQTRMALTSLSNACCRTCRSCSIHARSGHRAIRSANPCSLG